MRCVRDSEHTAKHGAHWNSSQAQDARLAGGTPLVCSICVCTVAVQKPERAVIFSGINSKTDSGGNLLSALSAAWLSSGGGRRGRKFWLGRKQKTRHGCRNQKEMCPVVFCPHFPLSRRYFVLIFLTQICHKRKPPTCRRLNIASPLQADVPHINI